MSRSDAPSPVARRQALAQWYHSSPGQALLAVERALLQPRLSGCFGYHLLYFGVDGRLALFDDCRVGRRLFAAPAPGAPCGHVLGGRVRVKKGRKPQSPDRTRPEHGVLIAAASCRGDRPTGAGATDAPNG